MKEIAERIKMLIEVFADSNINEFQRITGVSNMTIGNYIRQKRSVGLEFIIIVLKKFPQLNPDWLLFGTGKMYRNTDLINMQKGNSNFSSIQSSVVNEQVVKYNSFEEKLKSKDEKINSLEEIILLKEKEIVSKQELIQMQKDYIENLKNQIKK
jgi:hypothetical protein